MKKAKILQGYNIEKMLKALRLKPGEDAYCIIAENVMGNPIMTKDRDVAINIYKNLKSKGLILKFLKNGLIIPDSEIE